jgi:hypothetical protein
MKLVWQERLEDFDSARAVRFSGRDNKVQFQRLRLFHVEGLDACVICEADLLMQFEVLRIASLISPYCQAVSDSRKNCELTS